LGLKPLAEFPRVDVHLSGELAHLALGHPAADLVLDVAAHEDEVAAKVRDWGFTGFGSLAFADRPE
jgi:hypothetical protein